MTVIAWDGKTLAADGLMVNGPTVASFHTQKIFRACDYPEQVWLMGGGVYEVLAFGFAGSCGSQFVMIDALAHGFAPDAPFPPHYAFTALMITEEGEAWIADKQEGEPTARIYPVEAIGVAIGSGMDYAMGALTNGANAHDAVLVACDCNVYCGGDIQQWTPQRIITGTASCLSSDPDQSLWMAMGMVK